MPKPIIIPLNATDSDTPDLELPSTWDICPECDGEGRHAHAIDGNGITSSEWENDWDEESRERYLRGGYDKTCEVCDGSGKIVVVDEGRLTEEQRTAWEAWSKDEAAYRAEVAAERRMGC